MIVSYNWLNSYFKNSLPKVEDLAPKITMGLFEVEDIVEVKLQNTASSSGTTDSRGADSGAIDSDGADSGVTGFEVGDFGVTDFAMDFKILPDRAGYCYAHRFLAQEISAVIGQSVSFPEIRPIDRVEGHAEMNPESAQSFSFGSVKVLQSELCPLYLYTHISNIKNGPSPVWLQNRLVAVGQKSINTIVDLTNYVMLDVGQPLHAFDAQKVSGGIVVRLAQDGESIELLDGRKVDLDPSVLVIADDNGPLALAGVKGGKRAEVTSSTTEIVLEVAQFDPVYVRKTSQKFNIKNDSTKRFENAVTSERPQLAENEFIQLLKNESADIVVSKTIQIGETEHLERSISVKASDINQRLGIIVPTEKIINILNSLDLQTDSVDGETLSIKIPQYRNDILITEDVADEIGRVNGYEILKGELPKINYQSPQDAAFVYSNKIRHALADLRFSEVYTYTLKDSGDFKLSNPLNNERSHMRNRISEAFPAILEKNILHLDYLNLSKIAIFEIGNIFEGKRERLSLALGVTAREGKSKPLIIQQAIDSAIEAIAEIFDIDPARFPKSIFAEGVIEIDLASLISAMPALGNEGATEDGIDGGTDGKTTDNQYVSRLPKNMQYTKVSAYPYVIRDIAVFIPGPSGKASELRALIESIDSPLIVALRQFDEFEKKNKETGEVEKTSYAFRMIFQSYEKTLTDEEVQEVMSKISTKIAEKVETDGWEAR